MQGKTKFSNLWNQLNRCKFEGMRLIQGKINDVGAFRRLDMLIRKKFSDLRNWLTGGNIGYMRCERR